MTVIRFCYVFASPIPQARANFATHVPRRLSRLMEGSIELHVIYGGFLERGRLSRAGIRVHEVSRALDTSRLSWNVRLAEKVRAVGRRFEIDVFSNVWSHYRLMPILVGTTGSRSSVIARISGRPIGIGRVEGWVSRVRRRVGRGVELRCLRSASAVQVVAESLRRDWVARGISRSKVHVVPPGCDTVAFAPNCEHADPSPDTFTMIFVGRLEETKGVFTAVEALARLRHIHRIPVELRFIGEGSEKQRILSLAKERSVASWVELMGHLDHDDMPDVYSQGDVLVLPSQSEGLPNVVIEAQASGVPVVASPVGDVPLLLGEDRGRLVPSLDPDALAIEIADLFEDPGQIRAMTRRARDYVLREHSFAVVRQRYAAMFAELTR